MIEIEGMLPFQTLQTQTVTLTKCPVWVPNEKHDDYVPCNSNLTLGVTTEIIGDDYGSWPVMRVQFTCGHTFLEMENSLKHDV